MTACHETPGLGLMAPNKRTKKFDSIAEAHACGATLVRVDLCRTRAPALNNKIGDHP